MRNGQKWCKESPFTLMEPGALAHRAESMKKWYANHGVKLFRGWWGNSPDLNPIENFRSEMKNLQRMERTVLMEGLKKIAHKVWRADTAEYLHKLYASMLQRMQAVCDAQGGHTNY